MIQVTDENGDTWVLGKGDPGFPAATYLKRMGYERVMLPLRQILHMLQLSTADQRGLLAPAPTVEVLESINVMEDTTRYIAYASLLDQWKALAESDVDVLS